MRVLMFMFIFCFVVLLQRLFAALKPGIVAKNGNSRFRSRPTVMRRFSTESESKEDLFKRISEDINSYPIVLFMKGSPAAPQCGFSRAVCQMLDKEGCALEMCFVGCVCALLSILTHLFRCQISTC